jgi:LysR family transcriptional regulator for metE and metH
MLLDRSHLELLAAIAEHGQLGAAAESIHLSTSAASRRIRQAERRVGAVLVTAAGRSISLTDSGRLLADAAVEIDRIGSQAELAANWLDRGSEAAIKIGLGFYDSLAWLLVADALPPLEVVRVSRRGFEADLRAGRVDLIIDVEAGGIARSGLSRHELTEDTLVAVVPSRSDLANLDRGLTAVDLVEPNYLASDTDPRAGFEFETLFLPAGVSPRTITPVESVGLISELVAKGMGVTIQPTLALGAQPSFPDWAIKALELQPRVTWVAITRSEDVGRVAEVLEVLRHEFQKRVV